MESDLASGWLLALGLVPESGLPLVRPLVPELPLVRLLEKLSALSPEEAGILAGGALQKSVYSQDPSFVVSVEKLMDPSRLITLRPHTRFVDFPLHSHDFVEILYMVSGETVHEMPGQEILCVKAGELLMMNGQARHFIRRCGEGDVGVNFIVRPAFFDEALSAVGTSNVLGRFLMDALKRGESSVPCLHFQVSDVPAIQSLLESMLYSLISEKPAGQRILKTSMTLLFLQLLAHTDQLILPTRNASAMVVSALDEIQHRYASISFRDLAASWHVSSAYLSQQVKKATGLTCTQHLQRQRIAHAKRLLRDTDLSVLEICSAVGYSNTGYFYRIFQQEVGMPPLTYREVNSGSTAI